MQDFLSRTFLYNTVESYCWFVGIVLVGLIFKQLLSRILTHFVFRFLKKYATGVSFDKLLVLLKKPLSIFIMLITFYVAFDRLEFPHHWNFAPQESFGIRMVIFRIFQMGIIISFTWILLRIIDFLGLVMMYKASLTESKADDQLIPFFKESVKIVLVIFSLFFILGTVFHLNVASLIAGLGIGGLAIALAAKESLENLLGSFTIFLDQPFVIGDLVKVGGITGNVEKIGFRSTRIRTLEKTFVTMPNKKMVEAELENLTFRMQRRVKFNVSIAYGVSAEQIKLIVSDIKQYINENPHIDKEEQKIRFYEFGPSSVNIMVDFYVNTADWDTYADVREAINFKIMQVITQHGANFSVAQSPVLIKS